MSIPSPESRQLRVSPWGCLLAMVALLVLTPGLALWIYKTQSSARVARMWAKVRAEGQPASAAELEEFYALPEGAADSAPLWMDAVIPLNAVEYSTAAKAVPLVGEGSAKVPPAGQPWPQQEAAEKHLAQYAAALEKMHQAAQVEGPGRYPTDFRKGISMLLHHVQALRTGVRLLELEARARARQGDARGAAESLHAMFRAGESLEREPILVSQLVRYACAAVAAGALEDLLPQVEFSDEDLARLQADLEAPDYRAGLQRALSGERVIGGESFHDGALLRQELGAAATTATSVTRQEDLRFYLECMERYHAAASKPWSLGQQEAAAVEQDVQKQIASPVNRARYMLTALMFPALQSALEATSRAQAQVDAAATAVAVERYRLAHGRLPEKLDQLVPAFLPAVPTDPFTGGPLRYALRQEEYTIYSAGKDGVDNGGQEGEIPGQPDVTFTVKRK